MPHEDSNLAAGSKSQCPTRESNPLSKPSGVLRALRHYSLRHGRPHDPWRPLREPTDSIAPIVSSLAGVQSCALLTITDPA